jgi:hypothetical protein
MAGLEDDDNAESQKLKKKFAASGDRVWGRPGRMAL